MSYPLASKLGKYKHMIVIAVVVVALGAYFLPLSTVFAGHNTNNGNANQAARDKISKGSSSPTTDSKTKSNSGSSSNPSSSTGSSGPSTDSKTNSKTKSNDNSPQVGDNGNVGRGNTGKGNIGIGNDGNDNTGHGNHGNGNCGNNLNGNGNVGNAGNGIGGGKYGGPRGCGHGVGP